MKAFIVVWHVVAALTVFTLATVASCRYLERPSSSFASYSAAEAAGMFGAGWLLSYLPKSATKIDERHDIDTNQVWASFSYEPTDTKSVKDNCTVLAQSAHGAKYVCPPYEKQTLIIILKSDGTGWLESQPNEI